MGRRLLIGSGGPTISAPGLGANRAARERARASPLLEDGVAALEEELDSLGMACELLETAELEEKHRHGLLVRSVDEEEVEGEGEDAGRSTWSRICRPSWRLTPDIVASSLKARKPSARSLEVA